MHTIKHLIKPSLLLLFCSYSSLSTAANISPNDDSIFYTGRVSADHRFAWTGSGFNLGVNQGSVAASFTVNKESAITVLVDDVETVHVLKKGTHTYNLTKDLPQGQHSISVFKRSEAQKGTIKFNGLTIDDDANVFALAQPEKKFMAIGDSITCGYGNEAKTIKEGNTIANQNGYMSYAAITARELNAQLMITCWSGRGLYRNRHLKNDRDGVMPELFNYVLPVEQEENWQPASYVPDWILINLGTNDLAHADKKGALSKDNYLSAYKKFSDKLIKLYPNAKLIFAIGPMKNAPINQWLTEFSQNYQQASFVEFAPFASEDEKGGHFHPSVLKDKKMANTLVEHILKH
ncbi:SGNH/GDSL hydrolase family protein [Thalassomonas sp. M1454]|uniref:SGNH/GDSL hydrolase family protein n=1 Tax=Thalassomonas sp. M1454 TaxID=2594477 RepID=UPI0011815BAF|nr:SGNH/GDSL hydrolase family protein [Thalassomonas sp. M1454]TRX56924.1 hypothetical protein FNN08_05265 [Thalassomonas sp. M1454]